MRASKAGGPDWTWPQVPLDGVVELRVHGVGGTPPDKMLDDPAPVQVSGDRIAGVMRGPDAGDAALRWSVEGYSWGGLTGRSQSRALWLVVLPFALVNLAGWMATARDDRVHRGLVRLVGLGLTALYVLFAAVIGMDFAAYQCAGVDACATSSWWLIGSGGVAHAPAHRVVVGAALPVLVVVGLAVLTWRSRRRYELWNPVERSPSANVGYASTRGLGDPQFWDGQAYAERLAEVHIFTGLALVALLLSTTTSAITGAVAAQVLTTVTAVLLVVAGGLALSTRLRRLVPQRSAPALGALLVVAAAGVALFADEPVNGTPRPLPGILPTFNAVIGVLYAGALLLLVHGLWRGFRRASELGAVTRFRHAFTPFAVVTLAGLLTAAALAGAALWVADRLGATTSVGDPAAGSVAIVYPQPFEALARGLVLVGVLAVLAAAAAAVWAGLGVGDQAWSRLRAAWRRIDGDLGRDAGTDRSWTRKVRRALRLPAAALAAVEWGMWTVAGAGVLAAVGYSIFWLGNSQGDQPAVRRYLDLQALPLPPLGLSMWLLTLLPVGAAVVMRQALRKPSTRRLVAMAWDVATFWPRSFHPLCPPCYAERAVPEIQTRLHRIWAAGGAVVLLGHSQGAVLVTAAIASLPSDAAVPAGRLCVLTYGNPVHRLYARHFPAYVDDDLVTLVVQRAGGRLVNFYKDTDLVGHRLRPDEEPPVLDAYLPDPPTARFFEGDRQPEVCGHGERGYRRQSGFAVTVAAAVADPVAGTGHARQRPRAPVPERGSAGRPRR